MSSVWFLYSNRAAEGPTSGSLDLHIRRAHYISMIWRKASENHPCLPGPAGIWLDIRYRLKSLLSWSLFESTSSWSSIAPHKVQVQTWIRRKVQLLQEQYPMYRTLWMLGFQLQQQSYPTRDKWGLWRLRCYFQWHSWILIHLMSIVKNYYLIDMDLINMTFCIFVFKRDWTVLRVFHCIWICFLTC